MGLTAQQLAERKEITGSFLPALMAGDEEKIYRKWQECIGHPDFVREDLSDKWAVQLGTFLEPFALDWHERKIGEAITSRGKVLVHPQRPYLSVTLDGLYNSTAIDVKCIGAHRKIDDVLAYYPPQLVAQRECAGASKMALLIVHGGAEPREYEITTTPEYEQQIWQRVEWFWNCVETFTPPCVVAAVAAPAKIERIVDMSASNWWASSAHIWLSNLEAREAFNTAEKNLRELVEPDVKRAFGHGVVASRDRIGRISVRKEK